MKRAAAVVAIALLSLSGCGRKAGPEEAVKTFFDDLAAGRTKDAYESAAFGFQAQQSFQRFDTTVREMGLGNLASVTWGAPEVSGRSAKVHGEFSPKAGPKFALVVTLNDESGSWRVYALKSPRDMQTGLVQNSFGAMGKAPDFVEAVNRQPAPDEATVRQLATDAMTQFNEAVREKSFAEFYTKTAHAWQSQITEQRLQRAFQGFIDQQVELRGIRDVEPVFDGPAQVSTEGLLLVSGQYPLKPYRVVFSLKFTYELPTWRLFGIDVSLVK